MTMRTTQATARKGKDTRVSKALQQDADKTLFPEKVEKAEKQLKQYPAPKNK